MRYGFGVDIFGTEMKIGFFDETGKLLDKWKIATAMGHAGSMVLPGLAEELEGYLAVNNLTEDDIIGVGVGIPGPVNSSGVVNQCVNFGWGVFNIDRALSGLTGLKVKSGNIANLAALGECWKGSGTANMILVAMNTGLGGAVVTDGNVVFGANGGGGELGHIILNPDETEPCTCGRKGCAEQYCSPTGIVRVARRQLSESRYPSVLRGRHYFSFRDVLAAAVKGDRVAKDTMQQVYRYLGRLLAGVCCVTNPDTIVFEGEFCKMSPNVLKDVSGYFNEYVFHANQNVRFEVAKLGTDACIYGAFKLVLDAFGSV